MPSSSPHSTLSPPAHDSAARGLALALALSIAAVVSLGITRFSYGLLLPPMRDDLGWSYSLAGLMNTANALGYLVGALSTPYWIRRRGAGALLLWSTAWASLCMVAGGLLTDPSALLLQRLLAGMFSAWIFSTGGLLAARLSLRWPGHSGLLLGLYYGGAGSGIVLSALSVPAALHWGHSAEHPWMSAWWLLGGWACVGTGVLVLTLRALQRHGVDTAAEPVRASAPTPAAAPATLGAVPWRAFTPALLGYTLFGVGYIGYMTFVIALLRSQGHGTATITVFYSLLGVAVVASSRLWAGLLDRHRDGQPLARLNALLGCATVLPALTSALPMLVLSGVLFGAVFLSVVASTTALVRHNLPQAQWASGISGFTIVFALGQIVGPTVVGWIADGPGGLARGLVFSAVALWLGALLAWRQKALAPG